MQVPYEFDLERLTKWSSCFSLDNPFPIRQIGNIRKLHSSRN